MYSGSQVLALSLAVGLCGLAVLYADYFAQLFPARSTLLSVAEQQQMLASLVFHSSNKPSDETNRAPPRLAFCCSVDLDVAVSAVDLMEKIDLLAQETDPTHPQTLLTKRHHERIGSLSELQESFAFYFASGAAAEQSMRSSQAFQDVVALATALPNVHTKVGGNAATMAERAAAEGCQVLLGAAIGQKMKPYYTNTNIEIVGTLQDGQAEDVHLVLEYAQGDVFRGYTSPRANRYYLNHDVHNAQLSVLETFEAAIETFKPELVVFGGLQLMEVEKNLEKRLQRLEALSNVLQHLFLDRIPSHYEFAAVSDLRLFDDTIRLVLPWVQSIGLNEQELYILHQYLVTGDQGTATTSRPTIADISAQLHDIIQLASKAKETFQAKKEKNEKKEEKEMMALAQLSRIHFHTLQFHIVCQKDGSLWEDPTTALIQSALMSSKVACGNSVETNEMRPSGEMTVDPERIEMVLARQQLLSARQGLHVDLDPFSPIVTWHEADFTCYLVPMLACKKPDHTAGLGDNISGTGVAYHRLQKKSNTKK